MKLKIAFLLDKSNLWLEEYIKNYNFNLNNKYFFNIDKYIDFIKTYCFEGKNY